MAITRISAADLFSRPHQFSHDETVILDALTDEEVERAALADPDARPSTPQMSERAGRDRRRRLTLEALRDAALGAKLTEASPDLDLPLFEVTDEQGRTILLKASACRLLPPSHDPAARILKLEAIVPEQVAAAADDETSARSPERQNS